MRLPLRSLLVCNHHCSNIKNKNPIFSIFNNLIINPPTNVTQMKFLSNTRRPKDKVLVIMGPTGSGKSRLSVDIATRYFPSEIMNSDKIQVYKGLNITTNKIPFHERNGVPHHLLGEFDPAIHTELTPSEYRYHGSNVITQIISRNKLPMLVGGSNSLIYALLADHFQPGLDVFSGSEPDPVGSELRYKCCFLWLDVALPVLNDYLVKRVDEMLDSGMLDELTEFYNSGAVHELEKNKGLTKAIGVPEFEEYFRCADKNDCVRKGVYEQAVRMIKDNTCELAKRQVEKIQRLRSGGWDLHRIDGTDSFKAVLEGSKSWSEIWERQVVEPSMKIVKCFLEE